MTREEQYLAKIAGEEADIPNKPILRSEQYLAKIAGEDVEIPEKPLLNEEIYLAILTGESYDVPTPYNRIEQYMAKACGLEIEVPTPITRAEQLWAKIAEGGRWTVTEITDTLPLTFLSKGDDLIDYRIHGTTEGAGKETENLFNPDTVVNGEFATVNGFVKVSHYSRSDYISVVSGEKYYLANIVGSSVQISGVVYDDNKQPISNISIPSSYSVSGFFTVPSNGKYIIVNYIPNYSDKNTIMVIQTETAPTTYIPYGYKIPLLISDGTNTSNYDLMLGSDKLYADEYVDFGEQKIYRTIALMTHDDKTFTTSDNNRFCVRRSNNG